MTPKSRCRITAAALSETLDTKAGAFADEDAARREYLDRAIRDDRYVEGWRQHREKLEAKAAKPRPPSPNLEALIATQRPGHCAICDEPLPPASPKGGNPCRRTCGAYACHRQYQAELKRDSRLRAKGVANAS